MAATTISDLPRDVLVLIFYFLLDSEEGYGFTWREIHQNLRCVSRRVEWRDAADIAYIECDYNYVHLELRSLRNPVTVRARYPSLIQSLSVDCATPTSGQGWNASTTALALTSLCASSDLRRALKKVTLKHLLNANTAAAAVSAIAACPHLTSVVLGWIGDPINNVGIADMLAPLGALTGLKRLVMATWGAWPPLPDSTSLTSLELQTNHTFVPVGSDASLGRLRSLSLWTADTTGDDNGWASDDPFYLRAALDAGAWRPHLLTRVQDLYISVWPQSESRDSRVFDGAASAAAVWAPLAPTVTKLELACKFLTVDHRGADLETGMYAGLGALTGLRSLAIESRCGPRSPVDFSRVRLPHLTFLSVREYRGPSINLAPFPRLVRVDVESPEVEPLVLSSVASLRQLQSLSVGRRYIDASFRDPNPFLNLAQLFVGGRPLAAMSYMLFFGRMTLTWDAAAVPGALSAPEFAARAGELLPWLRRFQVTKEVLVYKAARDFVVPAAKALCDG